MLWTLNECIKLSNALNSGFCIGEEKYNAERRLQNLEENFEELLINAMVKALKRYNGEEDE